MKPRVHQSGVAMLEVLIAMLIVAFGVLGFVAQQARTTVATVEGSQRAQALVLLKDMAQRISLNRGAAAAYVAADLGANDPGECPPSPSPARDLCEWSHLIRGASEQQAGVAVGAVLAARGCVEDLGGEQYLVSLVWQGVQASGPAPLACGSGDYPDENLRRGVSTVLRIADLSAP